MNNPRKPAWEKWRGMDMEERKGRAAVWLQTRGVNLLGTKAKRRGTRADVLPMAAGSNLVTDDSSKSSVHAMAGSTQVTCRIRFRRRRLWNKPTSLFALLWSRRLRRRSLTNANSELIRSQIGFCWWIWLPLLILEKQRASQQRRRQGEARRRRRPVWRSPWREAWQLVRRW